MDTRTARDTLGQVTIPKDAYWGPQTQRAVDNFPISGLRLPRPFVRAQGILKRAAAAANVAVGDLDPDRAAAITQAADEVIVGTWDAHFVVDVYQAGAGTSQNMNANEVIANRAIELLGGARDEFARIHPNDHVNMAQSTNDTIHVATHIAALESVHRDLLPAVASLQETLAGKAWEFDDVVKAGRTHLQDAVPMRLGQEFSGWAAAVDQAARRIRRASEDLLEVGMGGTAVGTGINAHPDFGRRAVEEIAAYTGLPFRLPENIFAFMQNLDAAVAVSGSLRELALVLGRIASDLRLLSSGPRTGLAELQLPAVQPGSSIMPGKINPVIPEMMSMVTCQVVGNDAAMVAAAREAQLELNVMMPVMAYNLLHAIHILTTASDTFAHRCVAGITADEDRCREYARSTLGLATALNPVIGYERAAALARQAHETGRSILDVLFEAPDVSEEQKQAFHDLLRLTGPPSRRPLAAEEEEA